MPVPIDERPLRSVLYVPASNPRALAKVARLACDAVVFDLEDAVAPKMRAEARRHLAAALADAAASPACRVVRINALDSADFEEDLRLIAASSCDAVLLPKVNGPEDVRRFEQAAADARLGNGLRLWVMVETAAALSAVDAIAATSGIAVSRLECLVVGTNDIALETGVHVGDGRRWLVPWLMSVVLAARRWKLVALDGVWNDFADTAGFEAEARQAAQMAFDGKTLIHPSQIRPANQAFAPTPAALRDARAIVDAFAADTDAARTGVVNLGGRMVERLHLTQARRLLALAQMLAARERSLS